MEEKKKLMELIGKSLEVYDGMAVKYFQKEIGYIRITATFNGAVYCVNNGTLAFWYDRILFVTPFTKKSVKVLQEAGFKQDYDVYVPFSNGDYPVNEQQRWKNLKIMAREQCKWEFQDECKEFCKKKGISELPESLLGRCLTIPEEGLRVKHNSFENVYYPLVHSLDCVGSQLIGHYCTNNGRVVITYWNGRTLVTKGYKCIQELEKAGYTKKDLFVPLSNGEVIQDYDLKCRWDSITKN